MANTGRIFYQKLLWNGAPVLNYGVRFNAQSVPQDGNVCVIFQQDGSWQGNFPYTPEGVQVLIEGHPSDYNGLNVFHSKVRAAVMGTIWL